jgi:hypothetical protein
MRAISSVGPADALDHATAGCRPGACARVGIPIYGMDDRFAGYGTKTGARQRFERAGVSHPVGVDGLRSGVALADALISLRHARPGLEGAVVNHDDTVAGDGKSDHRAACAICRRPVPPKEAAAL